MKLFLGLSLALPLIVGVPVVSASSATDGPSTQPTSRPKTGGPVVQPPKPGGGAGEPAPESRPKHKRPPHGTPPGGPVHPPAGGGGAHPPAPPTPPAGGHGG